MIQTLGQTQIAALHSSNVSHTELKIMNIWYFIIFLFFVVGVPCFLIFKRRIKKYKAIAHYVGGIYEPRGTFKTGRISGAVNGRKYNIEPVEVGSRTAETHFRTFFTIDCDNKGMLLLIKPKFFKSFPNWKYISKLKEKKKENDFNGKMLSADYKSNSYGREEKFDFDESRKSLLEEKLSTLSTDPALIYKKIKRIFTFPSLIQIERDKLTLDIGELQLDTGSIKQIEQYLELIEQIAKSIENEPVPL